MTRRIEGLDPHPSARELAVMFKRRTGRDLPELRVAAEQAYLDQITAKDHGRAVGVINRPQWQVAIDPEPQSEHEHQVALFAWAEQHTHRWPELALMFAIANGGKRGKTVAGKLKAEGVKRGVPDICLPVPRAQFHGLYIELKRIGGKPDERQLEWRAQLRAQGYRAEIVEGWHAARDLLVRYLDS